MNLQQRQEGKRRDKRENTPCCGRNSNYQAESAAYQSDKTLKENRDKLSAESAKSLEEAIAKLNEVREGSDKDALKAALEALQQVTYKVAEEMYKASGAAAGAPGAAPPPPGAESAAPGSQATPKKDDVVDAEFRTN